MKLAYIVSGILAISTVGNADTKTNNHNPCDVACTQKLIAEAVSASAQPLTAADWAAAGPDTGTLTPATLETITAV